MQTINAVFRELALTETGSCAFERVAGHLLPCRAMARLPDDARTVLVALFPYRFADEGQPRNLSRYACVPDYHDAAGAVLRTAAERMAAALPYRFESFLDNSPIPEVRAAVGAGLGVRGDNGLLLNPTFGSYVFIGCIVTDAPLPTYAGESRGCRHCGACAAACPASCVGMTGKERRRRCLSDVTQRKGELTAEEIALMRRGGLVWGCDRCQEVCPYNRQAAVRPHPCFTAYAPYLTADDLEAPHALKGKAYGWRGEAVVRRNLEILEDKQ